jgi:lipopolysaccharide export LptBFGC system permease protein LptF
MRNLKLSFIITFLFALNSNNIVAQDNIRKEEMIEQMKMAKERLSLSDQQEFTFREITKKYGVKLKEIKNSEGSKRDKFKKLKESKDAKDTEMKSFLSEDQYNIYLQMQEERKAQMKDRKRD